MEARSDPATPPQSRLAPVDLADAERLGQVPWRELTPATQALVDDGPDDRHRDGRHAVDLARYATSVALGMRSCRRSQQEWEETLTRVGAPCGDRLRAKPRRWWDKRWAVTGRMDPPGRGRGDPERAEAWGRRAVAVLTPGHAGDSDARLVAAFAALACSQPVHDVRVSTRALAERCRQDRTTVRRSLTRLVDLGLLAVGTAGTAEVPASYRLLPAHIGVTASGNGMPASASAPIGVTASGSAAVAAPIGVTASGVAAASPIGVTASVGSDPTLQPPTGGVGGLVIGVTASEPHVRLDVADAWGVTAARVVAAVGAQPGDRTGPLARRAGISERTVSSTLRRLAAEGLVTRDGDGWCLSGEDLAAAAADEVAAQTVRVVTGAGGLAERHRAERDRRDRMLLLGPVGEEPEGDRWHELDEDPWADPSPAPPIGAGEDDPRPAHLSSERPGQLVTTTRRNPQ